MASSGVGDLTGRVLAGRYRLLAPIGAGASGRVYVADDVRLRRRVAVKVLHLALAEDAGFLRRFRSEAQVAASLNHPNVMAVYDWGEDDVPFMVLELLTGGSLRSMLDAGTRLSPSQAAHVGRQVTSALEYSHARGLVHRDIKPANLLFDEHGIVRVADFGLARALAEASWTEPAGTVVGTARYAAPEQATGRALDGRADLYSLAVVLVESVTGTVPGMADTAIGTLAQRSHTSLVAPLTLGRLGPVVERAGRADPDDRYPDAATMRAALADAGRALPPPQPLVLAGLSGEISTVDPTQIGRSPHLFDQDAPAPEPVPESFRVDLTTVPLRWFPKTLNLENYKGIALGGSGINASLKTGLINSIVIAGSSTLFCLLAGSLAAYVFSRLRFRGKGAVFSFILLTQFMPLIVLIIPIYIIMSRLGLLNTIPALVIADCAFILPLVIWLMRGYFEAIPRDLEEMARIDGCSRFGTIFRIILPLSTPGLAASGIFAFIIAWNEFFSALVLSSTLRSKTISVIISEFSSKVGVDYVAMAAAGVIASLPPVILALVFQKYIVQGLTAGAVKG